MHRTYDDITDRIPEKPLWYDEHATPRYMQFKVSMLDVYAREAALAEIRCQGCRTTFLVALTYQQHGRLNASLGDLIRQRRVHYGDPPNIDCCPAGASMNSLMQNIKEYWARDSTTNNKWLRDSAMEGPIDGDLPFDAPDVVAEARSVVTSGANWVSVRCTSEPSLYDAFARFTAAISQTTNVLVAYPSSYSVVASRLLKALVPADRISHRGEDAPVRLLGYNRLDQLKTGDIDFIVTIASPSGRRSPDEMEAARPQLKALSLQAPWIEFTCPRLIDMMTDPDEVVDGWRLIPSEW